MANTTRFPILHKGRVNPNEIHHRVYLNPFSFLKSPLLSDYVIILVASDQFTEPRTSRDVIDRHTLSPVPRRGKVRDTLTTLT